MRPSIADMPLFKDADRRFVKRAEAASRWISVPGGGTLFEAGEPANTLYFVTSGALVAHKPGPDGAPEPIAHIRAGEPIGEMALLAGEAHAASVTALRDSELLALDRFEFLKLARAHPAVLERLARLVLLRTRGGRRVEARADPRVFALVATSPSIDLEGRVRALETKLRMLGKRVCVLDAAHEDRDRAGFDEEERNHDVVLLAARMVDLNWLRTCLRQADRFLVLARRDARPDSPSPLALDAGSAAARFRLTDLVWLDEGAPTGAAIETWMRALGAHRTLHWSSDADASRLARTLAGLSLGLVLSGGGARAYAHLGAITAIRAAGLPIDAVGGVSMGAVVGAGVALGWDDAGLEAAVRQAFVRSNPLGDFTLPVVALSSGGRVARRLAAAFGEARIEDLRLPYFAASSNLSEGRLEVHRTGLLREVLRATIALPGILPPVVANGAVLVDGAVFSNLPADVMRGMHRGLTVGVDVGRARGFAPEPFLDPPTFVEWVARYGLNEPPPIASLLLRAATVHVDPLHGRRDVDLLVLPQIDDVEIRDWKRFAPAVAAGRAATEAAIAAAPPLLARIREAVRAVGG